MSSQIVVVLVLVLEILGLIRCDVPLPTAWRGAALVRVPPPSQRLSQR